MRTLAGPDAQIHFTQLSPASSNALSAVFADRDCPSLAKATAHQFGVFKLMHRENVTMDRVCLLDPKAEKELSPEDDKDDFDWFLFGVCQFFLLVTSDRLCGLFIARTREF